MRRTIWRLALTLLTALLLGGTAQAAEDGYLFRLRSDAVTLAEDGDALPGAEAVYAPANLYRTEDPELVRELEEQGLLLYAEPDAVVTLLDVPDDPYCADGSQWNLSAVGMEAVWQRGLTGAGVRVGVIDSGIRADHEDFAGTAIVPGVNYLAEEGTDARSDTADDVGHGTFVSGIIAASTNNGTGVAGMAPGVELVPLKCFSSRNSTLAAVVAAIYGAVNDYGCQVLNMSWGVPGDYQTLRDAIDHAAASGALMTAAVGNLTTGKTSTGDDPLLYPAAYDSVIGVGAVGSEKTVSTFSYQNASVFLTAPGQNMTGLDASGTSTYKTSEGTSYAAPMVTAAAALALSRRPELTREEWAVLLRQSAEDLGTAGYDTAFGWGLLRLDRLLESMEAPEVRETLTCAPEDGALRVTAACGGFLPGETVTAAAAVYRETGQLAGMAAAQVTADGDGFAELSVDVETDAAGPLEVRLFFLDGGWQPLRAAAVTAWTPETETG